MALDARQQTLLDAWCPGARLVRLMGWGLAERAVLHLATDQGEVTVKASPPQPRASRTAWSRPGPTRAPGWCPPTRTSSRATGWWTRRARLIDFGGVELAPALVDLVRLHHQDFQDDPRLEQVAGHGNDPRRDELWPRQLPAQAVSTAVWAFGVGDEAFEQQGHRMVTQCLDGVF